MVSRQRVGKPSDRMEQRSFEYFEKVRQGFLTEAEIGRQKTLIVDALLPVNVIGELIFAEVQKLIKTKNLNLHPL